MVPDLTLEALYLNQTTDFKMEFELCGNCNTRFLSIVTKNRNDFLAALSKSVIRSRAIIAVGSFNPLDSEYLPKIIAKATGYVLKPVNKAAFQIITPGEFFLPDTALPLVDSSGNIAGCVLESNDQAIIILTSDRNLRHRVVHDLVCPYLKLFADRKLGANKASEDEAILESKDEISSDSADEVLSSAVLPTEIQTTDEETEKADTNSSKTDDNEPVAPATDDETSKESAETSATEVCDAVAKEEGTEKSDVLPEEVSPSDEDKPKFAVLEQPEDQPKQFNLQDFLTDDGDDSELPKKRGKRGILKIIISIILIITVLFAAYFGYEWFFQPIQRDSVYKNTQELYGQTWSELPDNMLYKFGRLYQTNKDIYGWLSIPVINVNLPVVTTSNKSATYYDTHLFEGSVNRYGTLYTTLPPNGDFIRNTVIYGKDFKKGEMLSGIKKYLDIDHYRKAPVFSFDTLYSESKWKVFSVFEVSDSNRKSYTKSDFFTDSYFETYLEKLQKVSVINTGIDLKVDDELVTLVLQTEGKDVIVVARKVRNGESALVDISESDLNEGATLSEIPTLAVGSDLTEISSEIVITDDENMKDGASSRFEQQAPTSSAVVIKPSGIISSTPPTLSSSSKPVTSVATSEKPSSNSTVTSKAPTVTSSVTVSVGSSASTVTPQVGKLPTLTVTNNLTGKRVSGQATDIVAQILEAEMGSSYNIEALKAQAVAAYSWLLCNGSAEGKYPSAPMKTANNRCLEAANAVAGQVAVYGGKVAQTYYYAISAGRTANVEDIWSSKLPYLVSVDSSVDKSVSGYQTIRTYAASDVAKWAKESLKVDLTKISDKSKWFTCTYDKNGVYVSSVKIGTSVQKGPYLRNSFFTSARVGAKNVLRSSAYTIEYLKGEDKFLFTVRGYGHGVGMSQTGANAYAKSGWNYEKILKHYYTGISLGTYYVD